MIEIIWVVFLGGEEMYDDVAHATEPPAGRKSFITLYEKFLFFKLKIYYEIIYWYFPEVEEEYDDVAALNKTGFILSS